MLINHSETLAQLAKSLEGLSLSQLFNFRVVQFVDGAGGVALAVSHVVVEEAGGPPLLKVAFDDQLKAWKYNSWLMSISSDEKAVEEFVHLSETALKQFVPWIIFGATASSAMYIDAIPPAERRQLNRMVDVMFLGFGLGVSELLKLVDVQDQEGFSLVCLKKSAYLLANLIEIGIDAELQGDSLEALLNISELFQKSGLWVDPEISI
jgi:hypothetical protein